MNQKERRKLGGLNKGNIAEFLLRTPEFWSCLCLCVTSRVMSRSSRSLNFLLGKVRDLDWIMRPNLQGQENYVNK